MFVNNNNDVLSLDRFRVRQLVSQDVKKARGRLKAISTFDVPEMTGRACIIFKQVQFDLRLLTT